jgi:hypothetical protein
MTKQELADEAKRLISIGNKKGASVYLQEIYDNYLEKLNPDIYVELSDEERIRYKTMQAHQIKSLSPKFQNIVNKYKNNSDVVSLVNQFNNAQKEEIEFLRYIKE